MKYDDICYKKQFFKQLPRKSAPFLKLVSPSWTQEPLKMLSCSWHLFPPHFSNVKKNKKKEREREKWTHSKQGAMYCPYELILALRLSCTELGAAVVLLVLSELSGLGWIIQCSQQHLSLCTDLVYIRSLQVGQGGWRLTALLLWISILARKK